MIKVLINREPWNNHLDVIIGEADFSGKVTHISEPLILNKRDDATILTPTFSLEEEAAQELFNKMWGAGYRPQDGTGNSGHVESLQYHLEDMRKLVFNSE